MTIYYPRRTDGVVAEQFNGTADSVEKIARITRRKVSSAYDPLPGTSILTIEDHGQEVRCGDYVVVEIRNRDAIAVFDPWDFQDAYSTNGH